MIVRVSEVSRQYIDDPLLDSMFKGGLSSTLIETLQTIIEIIPARKRDVQDRLRLHITKELMERFVVAEDVPIPASPRVANTPSRTVRGTSKLSSFFSRPSILHRIPEQPNKGSEKSWPARLLQTARDWSGDHGDNIPDEQLVLALQTLSSFDFINNNQADAIEMMRIVREVVVRYLDDPNDAIRKAAAVTCAVLLDRVMPFATDSSDEMMHLEQVLDRLLLLGVGDDKDDIRASVFESLRPSLDHLISESENVHCLIEALNDESFEVRASAMSVLSRVAHFDTLHVMPLVRQTLVKLMRQLQNSKDTHLKQESVQLLQALVRGTNSLIIPYVRPMLEPLIATLNDSHPAVVGAALSTIGELAVVDPEVMREHVHHLFPRLIEALQDQSSVTKQQIAVVALGKLVSSLGMVVEPYMSYPGLFRSMVEAIQRSDAAASTLRLEALKTAGLLGALDSCVFNPHAEAPDRRQDATEDLDLNEDVSEELSKSAIQRASSSDEREDDELSAIDKYYLSVSINALIGVLRDPSLAMHHQQASNVVMRIVKVLREQCVSQLGKIVNGLFTALRRSEGGLKEALFDHVAVLVHVVKQHIRPFSTGIIKVRLGASAFVRPQT
jgi:FKBP12-rapamycin complex-associated protein